MSRHNYVCVHGHFYQPARENPFTGALEEEESAAPFANWNERITEECYAPNLAVPILDGNGQPRRHINTFEWVSFDLGPTILEWLKWNRNDVYKGIVDADRTSVRKFGGHGSAMAQSYNHTILPLSTRRDRRTQIRWGVKDFDHRFRRVPEGMWLPETAVDQETLSILVDEGVRFTVLSPYQAHSIRADNGDWVDVSNGSVDTRVPYRVLLGDGRSIAVFFYNGPLSQDIAFNGILKDGHLLAEALIGGLGNHAPGPLLANVATDGESYGHHHRFGDMALGVAIEDIEKHPEVRLTNYAEFLSLRPPTVEVKIVENSSWSCSHGVERWRSDCGCSTRGEPTWSQAWRSPLREALDWLRDSVSPMFESLSDEILPDPWAARDDYIDVLLGLSHEEFFDQHGTRTIAGRERAMRHLEIQRHLMLMYTSCGWFFDDVSSLETVIVLLQAARAMDLVRGTEGVDLEPEFLSLLEDAQSNVDDRTGRDVYLEAVAPFRASSRGE